MIGLALGQSVRARFGTKPITISTLEVARLVRLARLARLVRFVWVSWVMLGYLGRSSECLSQISAS